MTADVNAVFWAKNELLVKIDEKIAPTCKLTSLVPDKNNKNTLRSDLAEESGQQSDKLHKGCFVNLYNEKNSHLCKTDTFQKSPWHNH